MATLPMNWEWKVEPRSPDFITGDLESDSWLFEDDVVQKPATVLIEEKPLQPTRAEIASKLLHDLDEWIKEEPFSDWLEEKIDLPIFEDIPSLESRTYGQFVRGSNEAVKPPVAVELKTVAPQQVVVANDTQSLLQEFETVFGEVEELNNGTLTPPQSPTVPTYPSAFTQDASGPFLITTLQQMAPMHSFMPIRIAPLVPIVPVACQEKSEPPLLASLEQMVPATPVPDLAQELAVVDELIRTRVEDLQTSPWDTSSPVASESESELSVATPPSPSNSSSSSFDSDDPMWLPESVQSPAPGCHKQSGRKRSKPYSRTGTEEKRMRKKEQNKNAATRYRQKKKAEVEEILGEEKGLEDKNYELQQKVNDLSREIKYLKGLMRDVFKAKGLLK